jgi:hypothetical protein
MLVPMRRKILNRRNSETEQMKENVWGQEWCSVIEHAQALGLTSTQPNNNVEEREEASLPLRFPA